METSRRNRNLSILLMLLLLALLYVRDSDTQINPNFVRKLPSNKDLTLGDTSQEFATRPSGCYPNTGPCISKLEVICKPPALTTANQPVCPELTVPNGTVECPTGRQFPSFARYTCNPGYFSNTTVHYRQCDRSQGTWHPPDFGCDRDCPSVQSVPNGALYSNETQVTIVCDANYVLTGVRHSPACRSGTWFVPSSAGTCQRRCSSSISTPNGHLVFTDNVPDAMATLVCNEGFIAMGSTSSACNNGVWSTPTGTCQPLCVTRPKVKNGYFVVTDNTEGSTAEIACQAGYRLTGNSSSSTSMCMGGSWTQPTETCQRLCTTPLTVANGYFVVTGNAEGDVAQVVCQEGYSLVSTQGQSVCQTNGDWSSPGAVCQAVPTTQTTTAVQATESQCSSQTTSIIYGGAGGLVCGIIIMTLIAAFISSFRRKPEKSPPIGPGMEMRPSTISVSPRPASTTASLLSPAVEQSVPSSKMTTSEAYGVAPSTNLSSPVAEGSVSASRMVASVAEEPVLVYEQGELLSVYEQGESQHVYELVANQDA